jgi:dipeptidase D
MDITSLEPSILWKHFYNLTQIPRPSKNEKKAVEYIIQFAKENNLNYKTDTVNNIVISKGATKGMESKQMVAMQAHIDMVPQKNSDKEFDFNKDSIEAFIDGDWVTANGTTLGADNGIGVAAMLAVLESKDIQHGPLECLFTIDEETGMTGAFALQFDFLESEIMLNLDSEDEGELFIGCAGGMDAVFQLPLHFQDFSEDAVSYKIKINGLKGGHSGMDIDKGRGNANKLLARMLYRLIENDGIFLASLNGGGLRNAIPREAEAVLTIDTEKEFVVEQIFAEVQVNIFREFQRSEPEMEFTMEEVELVPKIIEPETAINIMRTIVASPNGVIRMSDDMEGVVETSLNMASMEMREDILEIGYLLRSSVESAKHFLANRLSGLYKLIDANVNLYGDYPGWKPNPESQILQVAKNVYKELYNVEPITKAIHAGLECGIIGGEYPDMDMLSFGPTIRFPHSPDEKVEIKSVEKFWKFLLKILENV